MVVTSSPGCPLHKRKASFTPQFETGAERFPQRIRRDELVSCLHDIRVAGKVDIKTVSVLDWAGPFDACSSTIDYLCEGRRLTCSRQLFA